MKIKYLKSDLNSGMSVNVIGGVKILDEEKCIDLPDEIAKQYVDNLNWCIKSEDIERKDDEIEIEDLKEAIEEVRKMDKKQLLDVCKKLKVNPIKIVTTIRGKTKEITDIEKTRQLIITTLSSDISIEN